jgi:hypothetical protein
MKALTRSTFVRLTEAGRPDRGSFSTVSRPFTKSLFQRNTSEHDTG